MPASLLPAYSAIAFRRGIPFSGTRRKSVSQSDSSPPFLTLGTIPVGLGPEGIALASELRRGFVACSRSNSVAVFDMDTLQTLTEVPVGKEPIGLVYDSVSQRVFTSDARADQVSVVDAKTLEVLGQIPVQAY